MPKSSRTGLNREFHLFGDSLVPLSRTVCANSLKSWLYSARAPCGHTFVQLAQVSQLCGSCRTGYLAISHYFNKTASPSPVMFWTVKAPFWYALVAPRPEETAHPLRSRQPPRGCAGQARRDAPTRNECRAHPERPRPTLRAGLAAPPTPLRTCAQCLLGRTLSSYCGVVAPTWGGLQ